ncbi:type IV pilus modification PilV family protein [Opacimonas viscosa]|uniref:Type II secretion system GspH family protein n=1 Tax=Opacimonas viscosa TaxID=2961944 RepID=A0AA42BPQ4_9ALTE|nr:type II secretion system protein [Opacimonas viscosa]MCP3428666.1 type II secretion system GspH family protein [Opacimonas viscosa]
MRVKQYGFTLIEMIAGMVVFGIVATIVSTLLLPLSKQSFDPLWQTRAAEISQSLINEISAKAFDENSDVIGGAVRCNETSAPACTTAGGLGPDPSETRASFDDVDDYHGLALSGSGIVDAMGNAPLVNGESIYKGFSAAVSVIYDDNLDGTDDDPGTGLYVGNTKLITITVTTPSTDEIKISILRGNF